MSDVKKNSRRSAKDAAKGGKRGIHPVEPAAPPPGGMLTIVAPTSDDGTEQQQIRVDYLTEGEDHPAVDMLRGDDATAQVAAAVTGVAGHKDTHRSSTHPEHGDGSPHHPAVAEAHAAPAPPPAPPAPPPASPSHTHENRSPVSIGEEAMKSPLPSAVAHVPHHAPEAGSRISAATGPGGHAVPPPASYVPMQPLLFEIAWEVCWQLGGIYTVIRSKAPR